MDAWWIGFVVDCLVGIAIVGTFGVCCYGTFYWGYCRGYDQGVDDTRNRKGYIPASWAGGRKR